MKLIRIASLLLAALLASCVGPYDYPATNHTGRGYYPTSHSNSSSSGYQPASYNTRPSESSINPWAVVGAGLVALWAMDTVGGGYGGHTDDNYDRCEKCSEPVGFSGRWCNHHAAVVQEQQDRGY